MRSLARVAALIAPIAVVPMLAAAQVATPAVAAGSTVGPPIDADTTSPGPAESAKPVVPATGYSYGAPTTQPVDRAHVRAGPGGPAGPDALMAGFETLADGSTRLFVELSKPVAFDTKAARSTLTYVLKGAHVDRRNNQNPLVTVHFNTPVTSARLAPHGRDLWLVVDLRASVQPTAAMDATKNGAAILRVDFPKGDYLPLSEQSPPAALPPSAPTASSPAAASPASPSASR
jgi:hypothetical protein